LSNNSTVAEFYKILANPRQPMRDLLEKLVKELMHARSKNTTKFIGFNFTTPLKCD